MYETIIRALKDFTEARARLDAAEKVWDEFRVHLYPPSKLSYYQSFSGIESERLGEMAVEFYRAKRAYGQLGNSAEICRFMDERDAMRGRPQYGEPNIADMDPKI